ETDQLVMQHGVDGRYAIEQWQPTGQIERRTLWRRHAKPVDLGYFVIGEHRRIPDRPRAPYCRRAGRDEELDRWHVHVGAQGHHVDAVEPGGAATADDRTRRHQPAQPRRAEAERVRPVGCHVRPVDDLTDVALPDEGPYALSRPAGSLGVGKRERRADAGWVHGSSLSMTAGRARRLSTGRAS